MKNNETITKDRNIPHFIFIVCFVFFLILQPIVYLISGIPLFMKSRWETFDGSGGLGIIDRLLDVIRFALSFSIFWLLYLDIDNNRLKYLCYFAIIVLLFTSVLNGSKMAILDYVFILSFVKLSFLAKGYKKLGDTILKSQRLLFILSIIGAFYAVIVHYKVNDVEFGLDANDYTNPIYGFLLRFVYSGDVYIMAYPGDVIGNIEWYNPFLGLFRNIIGMLRIVSWDNLPKDVGFTIFEYFNPSTDVPRGPTMKFDIFGYFFFGSIGSYVFSFLVGILLSYFINYRFQLKKNFSHYLTYSIICYYVYLIPINPPVAISKLFNVLIFFFCAKFLFTTVINFNFSKRYV